MSDIKYIISVDAAGAVSATKEFDRALNDSATGAGNAEKAHGSLFSTILTAQVAYGLARKAADEFKAVVVDSIKGAIEEERAERSLVSALEITGRTVSGNKQHYMDFAMAQHQATLYTHEQVQAAQTLLLQLTNLDQNGIDRATKGAIGLASVMGIDLQSAAMMVTKAMEGNFMALQRVGIRVDQDLPLHEKQAQLMDKLGALYKRATDETDTFGGALIQVKKSLGEATESFGGFLIELTGAKGVLKDVADIVKALPILFEDLKSSLVSSGGSFWTTFGAARVLLDVLAGKARDLTDVYEETKKVLADMSGKHHEWNVNLLESQGPVSGLNRLLGGLYLNQEKVAAATAKSSKVFHGLRVSISDLGTEIPKLDKELDLIPPDFDNWLEGMETIDREFDPFIADLLKGLGTFETAAKKTSKSWIEENQNGISAGLNAFQGFYGAISQLSTNTYQAQSNNLDAWYAKERAYIEGSNMAESEKVTKLKALDEDYAKKKRQVARDMAKSQQSASIVSAIINTAEGITKAWAQGGIFGVILAAVVAAAGALQIAAIKAQPLPALAKGGIVTRPTVAMIGEAGPEAIIPLKNGGMGGRPIAISLPIYVGGRKVDEQIISIVQDASQRGAIRISAKSVH